MKFKFAFIIGLFAAGAILHGPAWGQGRVYKYCLEQGMPNSFPLATCYYDTLQQCMASKTGPSDHCMINPEWTGRR